MVEMGKRYAHRKAEGLVLKPVRPDGEAGVYAEVLETGVTRLRKGAVYRFVVKDIVDLSEGESGDGHRRGDV